MNRDHDPCRCCARFLPTGGQKLHEDGPGICEGNEREAHSTDAPCVLFLERGSREARLLAKSSREVLAELQARPAPRPTHKGAETRMDAASPASAKQEQRRHPETISRASAPPSRVTASTTT